jgi:hypothetical protein
VENPKSIHRFLSALFLASAVVALAAGVAFRDWRVAAGWAGVSGAYFGLCRLLALANVVFVAPVLWAIGTLAAPQPRIAGSRKIEGGPSAG